MKYIKLLILLFVGSFLSAQDINPTEVTVVEGFIPSIPSSKKITETASFTDTVEIDKSQTYTFIDKIIDANYKAKPLKAASVSGEKLSDLYASKVTLNFGSHFTTLSKITVNSLRTNNFSYGLTLNHFSNSYREKKYKNSLNQVNLYGKKIGEKNIIVSNFQYDRRTAFYFQELSITADEKYFRNRFAYTKLGASIMSKELSADLLKHYTTFFISDLNEQSENQIHLSSVLSKTIKGYPINLELEFNNYLNYSREEISFGREKRNIKSFHFSPSTSFSKYGFDFDLGLELHYQSDEFDSIMEIFPQIKITKELVKNILSVEGGVRHSENRHTIKSLSEANPYIHSFGTNQGIIGNDYTLSLKTTDTDEFYVSMRNVLGKDEVFTGSVAYGHVKNLQSFVLTSNSNYNRFVAQYQDVWQLHANANYEWQINDLLGIQANVNYYNWGDVTVSQSAKVDAEASLSVNFQDRIKVYPSISYLGERTSESRIFDFEPSSEFTSLDPQFHANLAIHYNYSELMSAFVKINNITNSKKDIWEGYREIGINALFGLSYSY
ncbi:MAG: hypothetical protein HN427_01585 [Flavobacteriales bacterium]|nr:hypothetical protein [Flavobacteriales bacterium]